ncbi:hypothetical protein S40285_00226 [Stachybotrys chlorohalonatus IBT 40285]|uniref:Uncharacterized protein n=1 Tax=Stachybotrys chlorohalonatus (strain IBT 40285) TaxID=1283841 RepID=A0A084QU43_STAC4|nr:hypothetical protein S40285_00226 [Stachybotrys chlorohalonata IBT 40285]
MAPETPKGVSARLLTMKFMQRAAASASSTGSPESEGPSAKKRKLGDSAADGRFNVNIDQASIKAALEQQEATRQAALRAHTTEDTQWVLNTSWSRSGEAKPAKEPLKIIYVGYGDTDAANDSENDYDEASIGRTSTRAIQPNPEATRRRSDDGESSEESSSDSYDARRKSSKRPPSDGARIASKEARSRSRSRSRPSKENTKAKELRNKRKKKEVHLNKLTSISSQR